MGQNSENGGGNRVILRGRVLFGADALVAQWVASRIPLMEVSPKAVALGVVQDETLIAGVVYEQYNGVHMQVAIAAEPGTPWASRQTLRHLFGYPFNQMNCTAISVLVAATNLQSLNLATKLGFELEAMIKYAAQDTSPLIVLKMYRETCRWIEQNG